MNNLTYAYILVFSLMVTVQFHGYVVFVLLNNFCREAVVYSVPIQRQFKKLIILQVTETCPHIVV